MAETEADRYWNSIIGPLRRAMGFSVPPPAELAKELEAIEMDQGEAKELSQNLKAPCVVKWTTVDGRTLFGILEEWDNGTAIIMLPDGSKRAVRAV